MSTPIHRGARKQSSSRGETPRPAPVARGHGEAGLRALGVLLAIGSTGFAAHMIANSDRTPQIAGIEHLAIYARPTRSAMRRVDPTAAGVDPTPVGAIAESGERLAGFTLLQANSGAALVETPGGRRVMLGVGEKLDGLGRVLAIEKRGQHWVLAAQKGVVLGR
jgi:hypothetical protein